MQDKKEEIIIFELTKKEKNWLLYVLSAVVIIPTAFFILHDDSASIGDTIGGTTAPFLSLLGSVLVFMALKAQINANKIITSQFTQQQEKENIQNFENSFFNLMNFHLSIVSNIEKAYKRNEVRLSSIIYQEGSSEEYTAKGKQVFQIEYEEICELFEDSYYTKKKYLKEFVKGYFEENETRLSYFKKAYSAHYSDHIDNQFGNYFRNLYRLIKIIDQYDFKAANEEQDFKTKYYYTSIVRAQFSDYELKWLFLNGLSDLGAKFKPLMEKYALLKNISRQDEDLNIYFKYYENKKVFGN